MCKGCTENPNYQYEVLKEKENTHVTARSDDGADTDAVPDFNAFDVGANASGYTSNFVPDKK